eukprot:1158487-Pelagomonas_calceolata.AAC.5
MESTTTSDAAVLREASTIIATALALELTPVARVSHATVPAKRAHRPGPATPESGRNSFLRTKFSSKHSFLWTEISSHALMPSTN